MHTWFVTTELKRTTKRQRHPRLTSAFDNEAEAKAFAREKLDQGLIVFAGTINPYSPKQIIPSTEIAAWIEGTQQPLDVSKE
jgi:hypothetical protein